ncbi:MAG: ketopantoate reductase family protein [Clostridiales bacterium]|nr:ketopantoate reductase family protein [Clostridiales bacterium]MDY4010003.1 2-dehydropantoate 2-reductase N-terminal domain-containing protein [Candidatus Limiplasma sp.]
MTGERKRPIFAALAVLIAAADYLWALWYYGGLCALQIAPVIRYALAAGIDPCRAGLSGNSLLKEGIVMKVLVYGAGVIGAYLTHVLCEAGNDVTLLARGNWRRTLEAKGLTIRHHLQRKTTIDRPRIIGRDGISGHYDIVFFTMNYQQAGAILDDAAAMDADVIVLVGNNLSAPDMEAYIKTHSKVPKQILFGFQATAGKREGEVLICERMGAGKMNIGLLETPAQDALREKMERLFENTVFRLRWYDAMESFLKCHAAAVLPLAYLAYAAGCDYKRTTGEQRRRSMEAAREGYDLLVKLGYSIVPEDDDMFYRPGIRRVIMRALLFAMAKTVIGELAAAAHCRHAVSEMEQMDAAFERLRKKRPDFLMPNWDAMRNAMPDWAALRQQYEGATRHA